MNPFQNRTGLHEAVVSENEILPRNESSNILMEQQIHFCKNHDHLFSVSYFIINDSRVFNCIYGVREIYFL